MKEPSTVLSPSGARTFGINDTMLSPWALRLGDLDLVEDELQVRRCEMDALAAGGRFDKWRSRSWRRSQGGRNGSRRHREHGLGGAMHSPEDRLHAQRQAFKIRRHAERGPVSAQECQIACGKQDDVFENARARIRLELPIVGDGARDAPALDGDTFRRR